MHVLICSSSYCGLSGVFTNARELSRQLSARDDHDVSVLSADVTPADNREHLRFFRITDIPLIPQNVFIFLSLLGIHKKKKIDILMVYDSIAFIAVCIFARLYAIPVVFSVQASIFGKDRAIDYGRIHTSLYKCTNRIVARYATKLVCISGEMIDCMLHAGALRKNISLIPNPIDRTAFISHRNTRRGHVCLFVGGLRPVKGLAYLIRAVPAVLRAFPDARFVIVGDGPERDTIERLIDACRVRPAVRLEGYRPRKELHAYYREADLFILPSISEPQGIVILEAMASRVPIVASAVGGIREMIEDRHDGLLVEPANVPALSGAINRALGDPLLRETLAANALSKVEQYAWEQGIEKYLGLFTSILDNRRQPPGAAAQ